REIVEIARADPAVENVVAVTGGTGPANTGFLYLSLKPLKVRKVSASQLIDRLRPKLARAKGAQVFVQAGQDLRVGGRQTGSLYQYTLQGESLDDLNHWGPQLLEQLRTLKGFTDVNSDQQNRGLQASLVYDRNTAARLGISTKTLDDALYDAFGQ